MDWINDLLSSLDKIQGLSAAALVCFTCIVVGYALRFIKRFPNDGIPVVVILWGGMAMLLLADPRASTMPARIWTMRNLCIGLVIGFVAWLLHKIVLSRIEDFIASKFPDLNDTAFFQRKANSTGQPPPTDPPSKP